MDANTSFYKFDMDITLTLQGLAEVEQVVSAVVSYLHMVRAAGPQEYFFRELQLMSENAFRFKEDEEPYGYCEGLAEKMALAADERILSHLWLLYEYIPEDIATIMGG